MLLNALNRLNDPYVFRQFVGLSPSRMARNKLQIFLTSRVNWLIQTIKFSEALVGTKGVSKTCANREVIVIANGPSRDTLNFDAVKRWVREKNLAVFAVNFGLDQLIELNLEPTYLLLSDPATMDSSSDPRSNSLWRSLRKNPSITLVTPVAWHSKDNCGKPYPFNCLHFNDVPSEGLFSSISPLKPRSYASLSGLKALAYCSFLGFDQIFVIGLDNSYFQGLSVGPQNEVLQGSVYFGGGFQETQDLSHLYKNGLVDYFAELSSIHGTTKKCFKNQPILNLGITSITDAFQKISSSDDANELIAHEMFQSGEELR
ncbi:hypothetical protein MCEMRE217_00028 [Candidatus Nanopelagicaceae bacterium]